jgi:hypothetical protein
MCGITDKEAENDATTKKTDWIIVHDSTKGDDAITIYVAAIDAFGKIHSKCKERK